MIKVDRMLLVVLLLSVLSVAVYSLTKTTQISLTDDIDLDEKIECENVTWNEPQPWYGNCTSYYNETVCLEAEESPPDGVTTFYNETIDKDCYYDEKSRDYSCVAGSKSNWISKEVCKENEYELTVDELLDTKVYTLTYGDWGKCSYEVDRETVVITCDSRFDGNNDGVCSSGESCMQYRVEKGNVQTLMKNSRDDFVASDDSFFLEELKMEEVG